MIRIDEPRDLSPSEYLNQHASLNNLNLSIHQAHGCDNLDNKEVDKDILEIWPTLICPCGLSEGCKECGYALWDVPENMNFPYGRF